MPFNEVLVREGVAVALAVKLFDEEQVSLGKAAKLAEMSPPEFMGHLARLRIPVARYSPEELGLELETFSQECRGEIR